MRTTWKIGALKDFASQVSTGPFGSMLHKSDYVASGVPLINPTNIMDDGIVPDSNKQLSGAALKRLSNYVLKSGDVLVGRRGEIGRCAVIGPKEAGWVCGTGCFFIRPAPSLNSSFLAQLLRSPLYRSRLERASTGATMKNMSNDTLATLEIEIPPLPEQNRIVAILDEAFESIAAAKANAERNLYNARAIFESYLKFVFGRRGIGWVEKRLDEVCTFCSGGTPSKQNASYWTGKIPWISGRDMKSTRLSDSYLHISKAAVGESATRMAPPGTLLILVRGMGLAHGAQIGELMVPSAFNQDIRGIHPSPELLPRYLLFAIRDGINSSDTVLSNAAHGTLKIDSNELQKVIIPFPAREQQQRIVASIDSLAEETERLASIYEGKLAALDALKKSLLHRAFAGELTANKTSELIEAVA